MGKVYLLDCTLRDGGYVNNWEFGEEAIKGFSQKIAQTGIEIFEVGFIKGDTFDPNRSVFPDVQSIAPMIQPKSDRMKYVGMLDMSAPIPLDRIVPYDGTSIDGIRVIFKKDKIEEAYTYCKRIQELGYFISVNFVGTDSYTDKEFIEGIEKFNTLHPFAMSIVDTFGMIKRKQFLRLAYIADNNMAEGVTLAYHAHNNLQLAFGNAEALVEMNLKRDLIIDACVFGMGRGAGNLNLELFAEYMNENYDTHYAIEPMLEIMDEYLNEIYKAKFWGYSLPLYLSASAGVHPNYSIYLAEKNTLTVKSFKELLESIPAPDNASFSKEKAEKYYRLYQENFVDDKAALEQLRKAVAGRNVLVLAPGRSLSENNEAVIRYSKEHDCVVFAANFLAREFEPDFIFSSNTRRYSKIEGKTDAKRIVTSNIKDAVNPEFVVNFSSYAVKEPDIIDNSALMLLKLLTALGVKEVTVAGMDGYSQTDRDVYYARALDFDFSDTALQRNELISAELKEISQHLRLNLITPTAYVF